MKKLILGSAIVAVLGVASNAMAANSGTVNFTGAVSTATCNLSLKGVDGSNMSSVYLGTLASNATTDGQEIGFKLVPQEANCLTKASATMSWSSPTLSATGLNNAATNGTNATMSLTASNSSATDKAVKQGNTSFDYNVANGIKSFDFAVQLKRPTGQTALTAGAFSASANYIVVYK